MSTQTDDVLKSNIFQHNENDQKSDNDFYNPNDINNLPDFKPLPPIDESILRKIVIIPFNSEWAD